MKLLSISLFVAIFSFAAQSATDLKANRKPSSVDGSIISASGPNSFTLTKQASLDIIDQMKEVNDSPREGGSKSNPIIVFKTGKSHEKEKTISGYIVCINDDLVQCTIQGSKN